MMGLRPRFPPRAPPCPPRGRHRDETRQNKRRRQSRFSLLEFKSVKFRYQFKSEEADGDEVKRRRQRQHIRKPQRLLVERYKDGTEKRYTLDPNSQLQPIPAAEEQAATFIDNHTLLKNDTLSDLPWLPPAIQEFILPAGFPGSVSDDYLEYMLLQFPTNVTGWICHTLVTSSLLKAVGVGSLTGTSVAASAAAMRWVSKDGLGAIGRLFIGGRFGNLFDNDPKQWRMYADFIGSTGSIFELSTQLYPTYFLPLASVGNLAKAIGRGLKDPSFRVIQNHFAVTGNLGEIAAKEEVWEVTAQLVGLAVGILILDAPEIQTSYAMLTFTWLSFRILHLWLRYQSLSVLRFRTINLKRARVLVKSHVLHRTVPGYVDCNKKEAILSWGRFLQPHVTFGVSMEAMVGRGGSSDTAKALLKLYTEQKYILVLNQKEVGTAEFLVTFKVGATSLTVLRSLWHAQWLHEHPKEMGDHVLSWLEESLAELEEGFDEFLRKVETAGWEKNKIILSVQQDILFYEVESLDVATGDE